ncbi:hypothetical protein Tco_0294744 [Tanacetum coccineum]
MTTLADTTILSGAENRPPMLEKDMYDSWKSRMELYMMNRQHGRMILESVENGPLIWPSSKENGVTRPKKYYELSATKAIQADCDIKATNIILQGLPPEVYELVSNLKVTKELWERIQLLMQGTSLTKQERECKLYDEFDKYNKGETLHVKLVQDLHTTNIDQLHAYLRQHEFHANEGKDTCLNSSLNLRGRWVILFKEKVLLVQAQAHGQILNEEELAFLADRRYSLNGGQATQTVITPQKTEITSDSNIIPYSQYVIESQQAAVQNSNSSAQQDALILSVIEQLKTQVVNCTKINLDNKSVNDTLTAELERYKEQVKVLKEGQNVDLRSNDNVSDSCAQSVEIDRLKQTLSEHLKEKESLMQTVILLKNDFKKEESRNIDREIALEKKIKQLDNIVFKRDQSAQTVHMLTKPQFFYDHTTKQALGFQNPFYLKKAQQLEPKLYDGNVIKNTSAIVIPDSEETLMLAEESRSKMLLKQKDPMMLEKKVNTTPVDYANSVNSLEPTLSSRPTKVEVPKELPKVSMVNTSLKKLKYHLAGFDVVVKERTTPTAITEGSWGFEHTKACFRDEIIIFVKALKDLFNTFDQYLIDELSEVQNVFHQMEQAVEQHRLKYKTFEVKMNQVLNKNERLLEQVINKDIVNIIINSSVDIASVNMHECEKCLKLETELPTERISLKKRFMINSQFQEKDTVIKKLKEIIKSLSGKINEDKIKKDLEEIETINIELDHRVLKLIAENEHLKQTYKQLYDSIKPARIRSKEQCDDLNNQVNLNYVEISDLNASLQEIFLVITTLKDDLRKLKGKSLVDNDVTKHSSDPEILKINVEPITPKLLNKKTTHFTYIKHTQEEATVLRDLELLTNISKTCPSINNADGKLVAVTPKNKDKRVRFIEPVTSSGNTNTKTSSLLNLVSNKPMLSSIGVKPSTSASGSQPSGNTKKDKIQQTPSSTQKNKVEAHPRKVKSSLKNKDCVVEPKGTAHVQHFKLNANSELKCVKCNGCMISDNHDLCVLDFINNVNAHTKSKSVKKNSKRIVWKPTGKVRIMQISQENGQNRTNTDTGKEREYKSRENAIKGQQKSTLGQH